MTLPRKLNLILVDDLEARLKEVRDCVLVGFEGMPGAQAFDFRGRLRARGCRMRVVKNAIGRVVFSRTALSALSGGLQGTSALVYGADGDSGEGEAVLAISQVIAEWNRNKALKPVAVKAGLMDSRTIAAKDVERLAAIPSRLVLLTQVARSVQGPLAGLVGALAGIERKLVHAVKAVAEKRQTEATTASPGGPAVRPAEA